MSETQEIPAAAPSQAGPGQVAAGGHAQGNAITWPFYQESWIGSLLILLVGWFPLPLPMILNLGWMLEASAREAEHNSDRLPRVRNIPSLWLHGVVYYVLIFFYFVIPLAIFNAIYAATVSTITDDIAAWVTNWAWNQAIEYFNSFLALVTEYRVSIIDQESFPDFFVREMTTYSEVVIGPIVFFILATALFLAGMVRYAATRKLTSFFRPFKNLWLVSAHLPGFLWVYIVMLVMNVIVLSLHLIGIILWATLGMWIYAHLIGRLAARLRDSKAIL